MRYRYVKDLFIFGALMFLYMFALSWNASLNMNTDCVVHGQFPHPKELHCVGAGLLSTQQLCAV